MGYTRIISFKYGKRLATLHGGYLNAITERSFPDRAMAIHWLSGFGR